MGIPMNTSAVPIQLNPPDHDKRPQDSEMEIEKLKQRAEDAEAQCGHLRFMIDQYHEIFREYQLLLENCNEVIMNNPGGNGSNYPHCGGGVKGTRFNGSANLQNRISARTCGATRLDKACHALYDRKLQVGNSNKTGCTCKICGGNLYTLYCEERLYLVKCLGCGTVVLTKAGNPQQAAGILTGGITND